MDELRATFAASEQRFETILDTLAEAVTIRDRSDRIVYANRAALAQLGFDTIDELRATDPAQIMGEFTVEDEEGQILTRDDIPSVRILRGEEPGPVVMHTVNRETGAEQWVLLKSTPIRDAEGNIEAVATVIEDITQAKLSELRAEFLARAGEILSSSLDYQRTLRNVAELAVPEIADWCAVDLVDEQGNREQVVAAHVDPAKRALAERIREFEPPEPDPEQGLGHVMATGEPELYSEIPEELLELGARSEEHLRLLLEIGMRSVLLVPMTVRGRTLGVMTLVSAESGRRFDESDVEFAMQIARRAAVAVENARLYGERAAIAETLQKSLLPEALPALPGWEVAALYRPAAGGMEVGGDFYDFFRVGDSWVVLIGDVTGKGVQAASLTSLVRHCARIVAEDDPDPARIMARVDRSLRLQAPPVTVAVCSALCLRIDAEGIGVCAAGHPLPLLVSQTGAESVGAPGILLGAFDEGTWTTTQITVEPGDLLFLYTDGVTDTVGQADRFGEARLRAQIGKCADQSAGELVRCVDEALNEFQVGMQADDTAALALRRLPTS
jgi:PAS domain S-box-containing protein